MGAAPARPDEGRPERGPALLLSASRADGSGAAGRDGGRAGAGVGPKGWAVRPLKRYASWVQNVVRQFGPYPLRALENCEGLSLVREDRDGRTAGMSVVPPGAWLIGYVRDG